MRIPALLPALALAATKGLEQRVFYTDGPFDYNLEKK
jgi:hypothetical protein